MPDYSHLCGHVYDQEAVETYAGTLRSFGAAIAPSLMDSGVGKRRLLTPFLIKAAGKYFQEIQTIGDCVPHGWQRAWMHLAGVRIALRGLAEKITVPPATEPWYALARVEIGQGKLGNGDGSVGAWTAQAAEKYGTLFRQKYGNIDLTTYDGNRAKQWGRRGVGCPDELEAIAHDHLILETIQVTSYPQARDLIYNGFPVAVCSNQGFDNAKRDRNGFIMPRGAWSHCMLFSGMDDSAQRPGLLLDNRSWPDNWVTGPLSEDQPEGTGFVDADVCDKMLRVMPDSYSITDQVGFPDQTAMFDQF